MGLAAHNARRRREREKFEAGNLLVTEPDKTPQTTLGDSLKDESPKNPPLKDTRGEGVNQVDQRDTGDTSRVEEVSTAVEETAVARAQARPRRERREHVQRLSDPL